MKSSSGKPKAEKFDLKNTGPFTPQEAAARLQLASQQLRGFRLWHPQMHVAHPDFTIADMPYPLPPDTIPAGVVFSRLESIEATNVPAPRAAGLVGPFRKARDVLARLAKMSLSVVLYKATPKVHPAGFHRLEVVSEPGKGSSLRAYHLHTDFSVQKSPEGLLEFALRDLGHLARDRWVLVGTDSFYISASARLPETTVAVAFLPGEFDELEGILNELLESRNLVSASWRVTFGDTFYHQVYDETKRWFYFPKPELLEATGLRGNATELCGLVNAAGFPGATVTLRSSCTFEGVQAARAFFDLATRSQDSGKGFDRQALAMFQTEKGTFAQFCFGTKRGGQLFLKVLYPQFGGFGWEYAYEKLLRGEKLI